MLLSVVLPWRTRMPGNSWIQFNTRWYCCARESPCVFHPVSQRFPCVVCVLFETVPVLVWSTMGFIRPFKENRRALPLSTPLSSGWSMVWCPWPCTRLSPRGDRWCDVLDFVPASLLQVIDFVMFLALCPQVLSQAPQHVSFLDASHLWWLLYPLVYFLDHFPWPYNVQGGTFTEVFEDWCRILSSLCKSWRPFLK